MSWTQLQERVTIDWRQQWRELAAGTMGEMDAETLAEAMAFHDQLDEAYDRRDAAAFLAVKAALVKSRSWTGRSGTSTDNRAAMPAKPTAINLSLDFPT